MTKRVLALGLDPSFADLSEFPQLTAGAVRAFVDQQLGRVRALGVEVECCLVDGGETAEDAVALAFAAGPFDVVLFGAGLRAPAHLLLFERLVNLVHARAPGAKICFNASPADSAEAVQRSGIV